MANTSTNPIVAWFSETLQRLISKSPSYFKVWNIILATITLVPQIPAALEYLNITLPLPWAPIVNKIISISGLAALFISKLTVKDATAIASKPDNQLTYTAAKDLNIPSPPKA